MEFQKFKNESFNHIFQNLLSTSYNYQSITSIPDIKIRNKQLRATIQKIKKDIQNLLILQTYIKRNIDHQQILKVTPQTNEINLKQEIITNLNHKHQTQFNEIVMELVSAKEQNFQIYEKIEDTKYELFECKRILRFLKDQLEQRKFKIAKLFNEINNLSKRKNQFEKFREFLKNLKLPKRIVSRASTTCNLLNQTMDSNRIKMYLKETKTELQETQPVLEQVNVSLKSSNHIQLKRSMQFYP